MKNRSNYFDRMFEKTNFDRVTQYAAQEGLVAIFPKENELFIDIDSGEKYRVFMDNRKLLSKFIDIRTCNIRQSRSGGEHKHIVVQLKDNVTPIERLLLQAVLGSDLERELLGYTQLRKGENNVTVFLEEN